MDKEKLKKLVKKNGLKLRTKGTYDVSGSCLIVCPGSGCVTGVCYGGACHIICPGDGCITNGCGMIACLFASCNFACVSGQCLGGKENT